MSKRLRGRSEAKPVVGTSDGPAAPRHPLAMVYGGGGVFGIGYATGVAHGLAEGGIAVEAAPAIGTSAGSWTAAVVALGLAYEEVAAIEPPSVPNRQRGVLSDRARSIFGEATHPLVSISAVCVRSRRRHVLDGGRYPLADLVAASSAVPGLLPPHRIDGRLYVDGGVRSATSIDAAAPADEVIVVAPIAGAHMGPMGRAAGIMLRREVGAWKAANPQGRITVIRPNAETARLAGRSPMALFDGDRARAVYPLAFQQGLRWASRLALPVAA